TRTYTATARAAAGEYTSGGWVSGRSGIGASSTATASDDACYFGDDPKIQIVKSANGLDSECGHVPVDSTVTFTYKVTNPGNVPIANVVVSDNVLGTISNPVKTGGNQDNLLDPGETWTYTATAPAAAGEHTNVGTVNGQDAFVASSTVTANDDACYFGDDPKIQIVKLTNGTDNDSPTGPHIKVGDTVTWTYNVTNTGN